MTTNSMKDGNTPGQSYPVGTIWEMAAIPEEARGRFLAELPLILAEAARAIEINDGLNRILDGIGIASFGTPEWIDDDKNELHHRLDVSGGTSMSITTKRDQGTPA